MASLKQPPPKPGDYVQYFWMESRATRGQCGDGLHGFIVLSVGRRWVTLLHTSRLNRLRVHPSAFTNWRWAQPPNDMAARLQARMEQRSERGALVSKTGVKKAIKLLKEITHEPV